jgi:hypothetical protein
MAAENDIGAVCGLPEHGVSEVFVTDVGCVERSAGGGRRRSPKSDPQRMPAGGHFVRRSVVSPEGLEPSTR